MFSRLVSSGFVLVCVSSLVACGGIGNKRNQEEQNGTSTSAAEVQGEVMNEVVTDALDAAGGGESSSTVSALNLDSPAAAPGFTFVKTCSLDGDAALVSITTSGQRNLIQDNRFLSREMSFTAEGHQNRRWSKEGTPIVCDDSGEHAVIKFNDAAFVKDLKLSLDIERKREMTVKLENKRTGKSSERTRTMLVSGHRDIIWTAASQDASKIMRTKQIVGSMTRTLTLKDGTSKELKVTVAESSPLIVEVTRSASAPYALQEKTIVSGSVLASIKDGGSIKKDFANVKFAVDGSGECSLVSGSMTATVLDAAGVESEKLTCSAADGQISCTNAQGEVKEFEAPVCDPEDAAG